MFVSMFLLAALLLQDAGPTPESIQESLKSGVNYLKAKAPTLKAFEHVGQSVQEDELVLRALLGAGVPYDDATVKTLFSAMMGRPLTNTYVSALQAVILQSIDPSRFQWKLHQIGQFLIDGQCSDGTWGYGAPSLGADRLPQGVARLDDSLPPRNAAKPRPKKALPLRRSGEGTATGDFSNAAYAALGLRAVHEANILLPRECITLAEKAWQNAMKPTGGWCYGNHQDHRPYGSMSASAGASLSIFAYLREGGRPVWRKDKYIISAFQWMGKNFSVSVNPGFYEHAQFAQNSPHQYYYYMDALARAALLNRADTIDKKDWYSLGAKALIGSQKPDGSWGTTVPETAFAILFLSREVAPLEGLAR